MSANKTSFPKNPDVPARTTSVRTVKRYVYDADLPFNEWAEECETLADRMLESIYHGNEVILLVGKVFKGIQNKPGEVGYKSYQDQIDSETPKESLKVQRLVSVFGLKPHVHYTEVRMVVGPTAGDVDNMKARIIKENHAKEIIK